MCRNLGIGVQGLEVGCFGVASLDLGDGGTCRAVGLDFSGSGIKCCLARRRLSCFVIKLLG